MDKHEDASGAPRVQQEHRLHGVIKRKVDNRHFPTFLTHPFVSFAHRGSKSALEGEIGSVGEAGGEPEPEVSPGGRPVRARRNSWEAVRVHAGVAGAIAGRRSQWNSGKK